MKSDLGQTLLWANMTWGGGPTKARKSKHG